jgi:hypothetical protein
MADEIHKSAIGYPQDRRRHWHPPPTTHHNQSRSVAMNLNLRYKPILSPGRKEAGGGRWSQSADVSRSLATSTSWSQSADVRSSLPTTSSPAPPPPHSLTGSAYSHNSSGWGRWTLSGQGRQSLQQQAAQLLSGRRSSGGISPDHTDAQGNRRDKSSSPQPAVRKSDSSERRSTSHSNKWPDKPSRGPGTAAVPDGRQQRGQEREFKRLQRQTEDLVGGYKYPRRQPEAAPLPPPAQQSPRGGGSDQGPPGAAVQVAQPGGVSRLWKPWSTSKKAASHTERQAVTAFLHSLQPFEP